MFCIQRFGGPANGGASGDSATCEYALRAPSVSTGLAGAPIPGAEGGASIARSRSVRLVELEVAM
jgi:hypothetical protein